MDTITIELRSRLRSCNIFISTLKTTTRTSSTLITGKNTISLKLNESEITLKIGDDTARLPLLDSVKIIPKSLSSLTVTDNWISLRVQTEPAESAYGSFKREIVGANEEDSFLKLAAKELAEVEIALKDKNFVLHCTRCKNPITDVVRFKRVLPLPSDISDPGEWFCCTHTSASTAVGGFKLFSEPSESDCFYQRDRRVFNKKIFKKELKIDGRNQRDNERKTTVRCNRCLSGIGVVDSKRVDAGVKLWNCCVDYKSIEQFSATDLTASNPLRDFASVILDGTDIFTGNKILVRADDDERSHYLLVRVMDKNLKLLTEKNCIRFPADNNEDNKDNRKADFTVELTSNRVAKILYKYSETENDLKKNYSVDIDRRHVALPVMLAAVEHLSNTTKRYPPSCRIVDKYFVGYIDF